MEKFSLGHCWDQPLGCVQTLGHGCSSGITGHGYCSHHSVWMQDAVSPNDFRLDTAALAKWSGTTRTDVSAVCY